MLFAMLAAITLDSTACAGSVATACPFATAASGPTTAAFTTSQAVELILVIQSSGAAGTPSFSGGSFSTSLTQVVADGNAQTSIWYAITSSALVGRTVTTTGAGGASVLVLPFSASGTVLGQSNSALSSGLAAPSLSVASTASGSKVYAVGYDIDNESTARTLTANATSIQDVDNVDAASRFWMEQLTGTSSGGSVAIGTTAPTSNNWSMSAVEVCDGTCTASGPSNSGMMGFWGSLTAPDLTRGPLIARLWP